jgi:hypothetical protein
MLFILVLGLRAEDRWVVIKDTKIIAHGCFRIM